MESFGSYEFPSAVISHRNPTADKHHPPMPAKPLRFLPILVLAVALVAVWNNRREVSEPKLEELRLPSPSKKLSLLAEPVDWSELDAFQGSVERAEFERLLDTHFSTAGGWRRWIRIEADHAVIETSGGIHQLRFREQAAAGPSDVRSLKDLHIAIDPGHIGGEWAKIEERWLKVGDSQPVCEGDMTLQVARLLKPRLEALGARVSLVRDKPEPVTPLRPESLTSLASTDADPRKFAERLFYRTAEIRARAALVNQSIKPDLVLCLHFNAEAWGDPENPQLIDRHHFHVLVNGAYSPEELMLEDQRIAMLKRLLSGFHREEIRIASTVARVFAERSGLPPYQYPTGSNTVMPIPDEPFLWARNLLANRLYDCPVIFMEPYVMNSSLDHARMIAGDYQGLREIHGVLRRSIYQEYADAVSEGLWRHFSTRDSIRKK